jgi:C4-dicarboxylate-specific signal transduction histidine kinase
MIEEVQLLLAGEFRRREVQLETLFEVNLPIVEAYRIKLQQVLINLLKNALDAAEVATGPLPKVTVRTQRQSEVLQIEVHDSGGGLLDREPVFDPFYTTKPQGMGMGLAISRSIVQSHGGKLWVQETAPAGARFIFTLPLTT